jgi:RHS repeat-associated protein
VFLHRYVIQDQLHQVRGLTKRDGTWVASWRYGAYGTVIDSAGAAPFTLRYRWTGRELDAETGLYFFRARYYDPGVSRFTQEDPIGFAGGLNLYGYGDGNPTNGRDPDGLSKNYDAYAFDPNDARFMANCFYSDCSPAWFRGEAWMTWDGGGGGVGYSILTLVEQTAEYDRYVQNHRALRASRDDPFRRYQEPWQNAGTRELDPTEFDRFYSAVKDVENMAAATGNTDLQYAARLGMWFLSTGRAAVSDLATAGVVFRVVPAGRIVLVNSSNIRWAFPSELTFGWVHEAWHYRQFFLGNPSWQDECPADLHARAATGWDMWSGRCSGGVPR